MKKSKLVRGKRTFRGLSNCPQQRFLQTRETVPLKVLRLILDISPTITKMARKPNILWQEFSFKENKGYVCIDTVT